MNVWYFPLRPLVSYREYRKYIPICIYDIQTFVLISAVIAIFFASSGVATFTKTYHMETIGQLYNTEVNTVNLQSENTREWDIGISFTTRHNLCIGVN